MSKFSVNVVEIANIEPIADADSIELAVVGDYRSVVKKNQFKPGDLAVYIPEAAVLPDRLLKHLGLEGKLAGSGKNRVKAIKLRGCLSQGILMEVATITADGHQLLYVPNDNGSTTPYLVGKNEDVLQLLGIEKYEPVIPVHMAGQVYNAGTAYTTNYDIENIKKYPDVFADGEQVVFTEKIHGTFCGVGILPKSYADDRHFQERFVIFSKGNGGNGLAFKDVEENINSNIYVKTLLKLGVLDNLKAEFDDTEQPIYLFGEVFGKGVQDLAYQQSIGFRIFDIASGFGSHKSYLNHSQMVAIAQKLGLDTVPTLYAGPYSKEALVKYTSGLETVSGNAMHIREGIVVRPTVERSVISLGRVILKSVSENYLLRKGNVSEFQ